MSIKDIRYKRIGYVAINVTDPQRTLEFYKDIVGLEFVTTGPKQEIYLRCSDKHQDIVLMPSARPGLKRVAWEMESNVAWEAIWHHVGQLGWPTLDIADEELRLLALDRAFRTTEPTTGATFEFYTSSYQGSEFQPTLAKIARLGHIVIRSPDRDRTVELLCKDLNFRISDEIDQAASFLRCFPNPYHHSLGIGAGGPGLHHVNFMTTDIDDIGQALNRLKSNNIEITFGPGRHPPSGSIFLYFLDPDGLTVEYSFGMEEFPETGDRIPRMLPRAPESIDCWGGRSTSAHGQTGGIETLD